MKRMLRTIGGLARKAQAHVAAATVALALLATGSASAAVTLPDTGVDVAGLVTATITALGAVVLAVVGGYFGFLVIRFGLQWARSLKG